MKDFVPEGVDRVGRITYTVEEQKHFAVIDGSCRSTSDPLWETDRLARLDADRRLMRKPLEKITDDLRELFRR